MDRRTLSIAALALAAAASAAAAQSPPRPAPYWEIAPPPAPPQPAHPPVAPQPNLWGAPPIVSGWNRTAPPPRRAVSPPRPESGDVQPPPGAPPPGALGMRRGGYRPWRYDLTSPPSDYVWVYVEGDAWLVDVWTGRIVQVVPFY